MTSKALVSISTFSRGAEPEALVPANRLRFSGDNAFHLELKRRVRAHLLATGRRERGCPEMYFKTAIIVATFASLYALLVFAAGTWWQALPLALGLALTMVAIGFNVMHDANHDAYSDHRWINRPMAMSLDLVGGSSYFWQWKHNVFHHTFVNVIGYDTDINLAGLGRLTPHHRRAWIHRWQHCTSGSCTGHGREVAAVRRFPARVHRQMGGHRFPRPRGPQWLVFFGGKLVFLSLAFACLWPCIAVGGRGKLCRDAVMMGVVLGVVFQLAHCVEQADFPTDRGSGRMSVPWAVHQVETSVDFARGSRTASWLLGGLNFQIEHHLFSRICHVNYPAIAPLVEADLPGIRRKVQAQHDLLAALRSHYCWLRAMGRADVPGSG